MEASFAPTHGGFRRSYSQSASCVFLFLKPGYLGFAFSDRQSHHCEGSEKNCRQRVSIWTAAAVGPPFPPQLVASALLRQEVTACPNRRDSRVSRWRTAITAKVWWSDTIEGPGIRTSASTKAAVSQPHKRLQQTGSMQSSPQPKTTKRWRVLPENKSHKFKTVIVAPNSRA
jgi:hypothetical protein